ncbi:MAG TPA: cellulase family glycosylhydrolase [Bacteroidota bacterium]|nr:cellulase family glycosylhydrolase [Bacteroidota bacterium]
MKPLLALVFCAASLSLLPAQVARTHTGGVFVDSLGVMRWIESCDEVSLFGVNYTVPFAYAYRAHQRLGLPIKKAIDLDVAQMKRLGLDAFRVHVWEKEISDSLGNLIANEHLDLYDYLVAQLSRNGIKTIATPIAWWATGWPEPDVPTGGYTQKYGKMDLITNAGARAAQRRYLKQFVNHVNPYTKHSLKDDPAIIAFEIINEPRHPDSAQQVTAYIDEMAEVMRAAGVKKPIFYNISETWSALQANAVAAAKIDGMTFQWYPTGLVHGAMLKGNYLVNVNRYAVPSEKIAGYGSKAKVVYEFDAADVGGSFMYPAMARSFRGAGMQCATMFAYDPSQIAWSNTEYPTHFMNLLYTPSKAISLMIAGKAFRRIPRGASYGTYPENSSFDAFRVSGDEDLSVMNTDTEFLYSNATRTVPKQSDRLEQIAGCGSSPVVQYNGTGAYFLDKIEDGIWRLEVYPDALWIRDPFEQTSMTRQVSRLFWNERAIDIALPDLGNGYALHALSGTPTLHEGRVYPGVYIVTRAGMEKEKIAHYCAKTETFLDGLYLPAPAPSGLYVVNLSQPLAPVADSSAFAFTIAGDSPILGAELFVKREGWRGYTRIPLRHIGGFSYIPAQLPASLHTGRIEYCVTVHSSTAKYTFPGEQPGDPTQWDFSLAHPWRMDVPKRDEEITLIDAEKNRTEMVFPLFSGSMRYAVDYGNGASTTETALSLTVNFSGTMPASFACQTNISATIRSLGARIGDYVNIIVRGRSLRDSAETIAVMIMTTDGETFGADVTLARAWTECRVPIASMKKRPMMILPGSYPLFLDKVRNGGASERESMAMTKAAVLQFGMDSDTHPAEHRFDIVSIRLAK